MAQETSPKSDSLAAGDSLLIRFIPRFGELVHASDSPSELPSSQIIWSGASTVEELLARQPGWFIRELGEPGQPSQPNFLAGDWRGVAVLLDGRPLNDPVTGAYNISDIPVEYIDHIELLKSPRALAVTGNATTAVLNIVTHQYSTRRPITKIRFLQGPFEHTLTDALFTQNIAPATNLTVGVVRHVSDGRFANAALDFWNIRTRIRYNISPRLNVIVSDLYTSATMGMNGGVWYDSTNSVFEERLATVRYPDAVEDRSRHDLTAAVVARLLDDSLSLSQWTFYHSRMERAYRDASFPFHDVEGTFSWQTAGLQLIQHGGGSFFSAMIGTQLEGRTLTASNYLGAQHETYAALFGSAEVFLLSRLSSSVSMRHERTRNVSVLSYGGEMSWNAADAFRLNASYAQQSRLPGFREKFEHRILDAGPVRPHYETHRIAGAGMQFHTSSFSVDLTIFRRAIENATWYRTTRDTISNRRVTAEIGTVEELRLHGAIVSSTLRVWKLDIRGSLSWTQKQHPPQLPASFPSLLAMGEVSYRDKLFNDKLELTIGLASRYISSANAFVFIPATGVFSSYEGTLGRFSTFDLFGVFKIGDAFIDVRYENVPDIRAMTTFAHPLMGGNLKFGINWRFLD
jgi:outer membrane cobalamin receptor